MKLIPLDGEDAVETSDGIIWEWLHYKNIR